MPQDTPFAAAPLTLTMDEAKAYAVGRAAPAPQQPPAKSFRAIGPKHLRILECDFAKPQARNDGARELERPPSMWPERPPRPFTGGDWE